MDWPTLTHEGKLSWPLISNQSGECFLWKALPFKGRVLLGRMLEQYPEKQKAKWL